MNDDDFTIIYNDDGSGVPINNGTCKASGYECNTLLYNRIIVTDSSDYVRGKVATFRWTGGGTSGNLFREDVNNGDHCFTCKATHGDVTREFDVGCIKGNYVL